MALVKWNDRLAMPAMSSLFNSFFDDDRNWSLTPSVLQSPSVNVAETEDAYTLEVAAPGKAKDDFEISISNGLLSIRSETEETNEEKEKNYTRQEYSFNSFERSFSLPENANVEDVQASYQDGVLSVVIPKKSPGEAAVTKIEIA